MVSSIHWLQLTSFVFEATGFILTVIEVLRPQTADRIEVAIDRVSQRLEFYVRFHLRLHTTVVGHTLETTQEVFTDGEYTYGWKHPARPEYGLTTAIPPSLLGPIAIVGVFASLAWLLLVVAGGLSFVYGIVVPVLFVLAVVILYLPEIIAFANRKTDDSALGAIGLALAFVGLSIELLQLLTPLVSGG